MNDAITGGSTVPPDWRQRFRYRTSRPCQNCADPLFAEHAGPVPGEIFACLTCGAQEEVDYRK
jgi:hypothetical protein